MKDSGYCYLNSKYSFLYRPFIAYENIINPLIIGDKTELIIPKFMNIEQYSYSFTTYPINIQKQIIQPESDPTIYNDCCESETVLKNILKVNILIKNRNDNVLDYDMVLNDNLRIIQLISWCYSADEGQTIFIKEGKIINDNDGIRNVYDLVEVKDSILTTKEITDRVDISEISRML